MCFSEFVRAVGKRRLADLLDVGEPCQVEPYAVELTDLLKRYLVVGGMPEAVNVYVETDDFRSVRGTQEEILSAYDADFVKHAPSALLPKIRLLWHSIPSQLAKENKKFIYTALKAGARAREYEARPHGGKPLHLEEGGRAGARVRSRTAMAGRCRDGQSGVQGRHAASAAALLL